MIIKLQNDENSSIQMNHSQTNNRRDHKAQEKKNTSIKASELNLQDNVLTKKLQAHKKAIKTVMDAFSGEQVADDSIRQHQKRAQELTEEANTYLGEINRLNGLKKDLQETSGVDDNSQEQKDLMLLEKKQKGEALTKDEQKQLSEMGPLTEYQKASLEYSATANVWNKRLEDAKSKTAGENRTVDAIKLAQVKTHTVVDANKTAQDIMDQASKDIVNTLIDEAKDKVDEELEEKEAEAEKKAEEEEAKQEKLEKNKKDEQKIEDSTDQLSLITKADNAQDKLQKEIQVMIDNQKLLEEDIKGIAVDEML